MPPGNATTDSDGDGVDDTIDACPDTPAGDMVDDTGCSLCPCDAAADGTPWPSRNAYIRCIKLETRHGIADAGMTRGEARDAVKRALLSTCGRRALTRCCVVRASGTRVQCRLMDSRACDLQRARGVATDAGTGSCLPSPCAP